MNNEKYRMTLCGGPQDGHVERVKFLDSILEYYTAPGRIAIYKEISKGHYIFDGYKRVLDADAPEQKVKYYPNFDELEDRSC